MQKASAITNGFGGVSASLAIPALAILLIVICLLRCYAGLFGVLAYPHDVFALIDPAWRILHHQIPHIDFYSQLGPVPYLETAAGLMIARNGIEGLIYGQVLSGLAITVWMYLMARGSLSRPLCFLLTLYTLLLCISPYNIGEGYSVLSAAMTYNRLSYGISAIVLVEALSVRRDGVPTGVPGGFSTGAALALLLFTKITFFAGAVFLVCAFALLFPQTKARWAGMAAGFGVFSFALLCFLQFQVSAIFHDYRLSAGAKHIGLTKLLASALEIGSDEGISLTVFVCLTLLVLRPQAGAALAKKFGLSGGIVLLTSSFLLFGNFQGRGLPLDACFAIIVADVVIRTKNKVAFKFWSFGSLLALWAVLLAAGPVLSGLAGISYAAVERMGGKVAVRKSPGLASFRIRDAEYADFVDDGVTLAKEYLQSGDTIISLDFSDFYSYALRIMPPQGGASCLHFDSTFNDKSHPEPERLLSGASLVMMPIKFSEAGSQKSVTRIYGPYLLSHYRLEGSSRQWRVYRRNL